LSVHTAHHCEQRGQTERLVGGLLSGPERRAAQQHLEECESCRSAFRQETANRFPRLRNYTVVERVAGGGFGVVYRVIHHAKQRTEALKVLFSKTALRARYFQNEVHLIARLRHPNIATLYEAHLGSPPLFYSMEYVEGEELDAYLSRHQPALRERIELVQTVAQAVGYAHAQGVVHRDLKPQNILVDTEGHPHIIDFGIARKLGLTDTTPDATRSSPEGAVGTLGYSAPEQLAGEPVDERADLYALGALLHHCITGESARRAAWSEHLIEVLHARQVTRAEDLAAIIARSVDAVPERRYPSCAALVEDLDNYLAGRPIRAYQHATLAYRLARSAAFVLRMRPLSIRVLLVLLTGWLAAFVAWRAEARWLVPGQPLQPVALAAYTERTTQAIAAGRLGPDGDGLDLRQPKSLRMLYGRVLRRLAEAEPRAVVCDFHTPDCQPQFDPELIAGLDALRTAGIPAVVGVLDLDVNSEPQECRSILAAAHAYGTLVSTHPRERTGEWLVPVCVQRGFARPVPGLAVAGFAAARFPDAHADLEIQPGFVALRYRKDSVPAGESRWYQDSDQIRYDPPDRITQADYFRQGDLVFVMHVAAPVDDRQAVPRMSFEEILAADRGRLRDWCRGRAVVVGQTVPGQDEWPTLGSGRVFGCEVQAHALQALLSQATVSRIGKGMLAATMILWGALAAALVDCIPCGRTVRLRRVAAACLFGLLAGLLLTATGAKWVTGPWQLQTLLAVGAILVTGGPVYLARAVREQQMQLAPETKWSAEHDRPPSTILAGGAGPAVSGSTPLSDRASGSGAPTSDVGATGSPKRGSRLPL